MLHTDSIKELNTDIALKLKIEMKNLINGQSNDAVTHHSQQKRLNYLKWEDYFMANAILSSYRSKDPITQVGACIVNKEKKIVGIGYNGMPKGCNDDELPWGKDPTDALANKHLYVCHAEMNAIMNKNSSNVENCTLFVTLFPCNECAKIIIQSGITEIVYMNDKDGDRPQYKASRKLLEMAKVNLRQFKTEEKELIINLKP